jgi:hypothetical protein
MTERRFAHDGRAAQKTARAAERLCPIEKWR